ncbi:MAG: hypothetical protein ACE5GU_13420 [Candidatus Scalinduaceae bacterium]
MSTITLCCEFKDEYPNVRAVFNTFSDIVDEINVLDTGSTDGTQELCKKLGAKVFQAYIPSPYWSDKGYENGVMGYGEMRTLHINLVKTDWAFIFDGDERMLKQDVFKLKKLADEKMDYDCIALPRQNYRSWDMSICENPDISKYADWQFRFVKAFPHYKVHWVRKVHEQLRGVDKIYQDLTNPVIRHFGFLKTEERKKMVVDVCNALWKVDEKNRESYKLENKVGCASGEKYWEAMPKFHENE